VVDFGFGFLGFGRSALSYGWRAFGNLVSETLIFFCSNVFLLGIIWSFHLESKHI
jgi:hypothetical protein